MAQAPRCLEGRPGGADLPNIAVADGCRWQNTGSEATSVGDSAEPSVTGRQHFIVVQGGYNGNHDELACNVVNSLAEIGPRVSPGEYPPGPMGAGTTIESTHFVHPGELNDLDSVRYVCQRYPIRP